MEHILSLISLLVFCIVIRLPFALKNPTDGWITYVLIANQKGRRFINLKAPLSVIENGYLAYPPLAHYLVSRFPERMWKTAALGLTYLCDALIAVFLYFVLLFLFERHGLRSDQIGAEAFFLGLIFLSLPILLPVSARVRAPNGRALGFLFTTMFFLFLWLSMYVSWWFVLPAFGVAMLIVLSSKFALQVIFFITPIVALFVWDARLLIPLFLVVLYVLLRPHSVYAYLLRDKIAHSFRYSIKGSTAENRNLFRNFFLFFSSLRKDYLTSCLMLRLRSPLLILLVSLPHVFVVIPMLFFSAGGAAFLEDPVVGFCLYIVIATTIVFAATSVGILRIFGQSERYFEYASPAVMILLAYMLLHLNLLNGVISGFLLVCNFCLLVFLHIATDIPWMHKIGQFQSLYDRDILDTQEYITQFERLNIGTVPTKTAFVFQSMAMKNGLTGLRYYHSIFTPYPVRIDSYKEKLEVMDGPFLFNHTPAWIREKYGIDMIIEDTEFSKDHPEHLFIKELHKQKPAFEAGRLRVFNLKGLGMP